MKRVIAVLFCCLVSLAAGMASAKETKDIAYKMKTGDTVVFSHDLHLAQYNNNCRVCHNAIFNLKSRKHFSMAEMEKTRSCGACHTGIKAFSVTSEKDCARCHRGGLKPITYKVKNATPAIFPHDVHLAATGGKCRSCHGSIITGAEKNVTMEQMEKGKTCGACHNGKKAFTVAGNCGKCHKGMTPRTITFNVKGISNATFSHDVHTAMYKCADCHTKLFAYKAGLAHVSMGDMDKGKSCGACHNGKDAFSSAGDCEKCHNGFKPGPISFKVPDVGNVSFSHELHTGMYKCPDCHTKAFPFKAGSLKRSMPDMEAGKSCGGCHNAKDAFSVKGDCEKCHKM